MPNDDHGPIGIFDSGVGGLTVMRAVVSRLPMEDVIYLGDTARVPYGNRGAETVRRYAENAAQLLVNRQIKALVVACNTASAFALDALQSALSIPVFGVIDPVARRAASYSQAQSIAVLGTRGTIGSNAYQRRLLNLSPHLNVHPIACPLLAPLVEEGWLEGPVPNHVLNHYLAPLATTDVDTMILGCTHYPLLRPAISQVTQDILGRSDVELLDSATATAEALETRLRDLDLLDQHPDTPGTRQFLVTDQPEHFVAAATRFFGRSIDGQCHHVDIVDGAHTSLSAIS